MNAIRFIATLCSGTASNVGTGESGSLYPLDPRRKWRLISCQVIKLKAGDPGEECVSRTKSKETKGHARMDAYGMFVELELAPDPTPYQLAHSNVILVPLLSTMASEAR